jgi:hypothetical protein
MPAKTDTPATTRLVLAAWELFGENWQSAVARLTHVPQRTLSRMFYAHLDGRDYRGAADALDELAKALADRVKVVRRAARAARQP